LNYLNKQKEKDFFIVLENAFKLQNYLIKGVIL